jgi:hypothetical protein
MAAQLLESTAGALFRASWQAGILAVVVLAQGLPAREKVD